MADVTGGTASGNLVIDYDAAVPSTAGQVYTAAAAPVIINTGAAGYSAQFNQTAGTPMPKKGISMSPAATAASRVRFPTATIPETLRPVWQIRRTPCGL